MPDLWTADNPPDNKDRIWEVYRTRYYCRVLELGPLDGRDTMHLARHCERLSTIEARGENAVATRKTCDQAGVYNVTIYMANLESFDIVSLGWFDAVWCVGLLYHLPNPWMLARSLAGITDLVYGWSHVASNGTETRAGYRGCPYREGGVSEPLSGMSPESFWVTPKDFPRLWQSAGFRRFEWLKAPSPHPNGQLAGQFLARRR